MRLPARLWLRRLHLVLGLALGAVLAAVAGSGAALVFRDEIRALAPGAPPAAPVPIPGPVLDFAAARDLARAARPGHDLQILWFPTEARPHYEAAYRAPDGEEFAAPFRFHPATGAPLPIPESPVLDWIETFHVNLHLGDAGAFLVRWCTLLFSLVLLSGLYLWWPGLKPHLWLAIRQGRLRLWDAHRVLGLRLWDAHRVLGFATAIPLLLMMASGLVFAFPAARAAAYLLTGSSPPPAATLDLNALRSTPPADPADPPSPAASDEALLASARALSPADAFVFYLTFPLAPDEPRRVRLQRGYSPFPYGEVHRIHFDRHSGAVLGHLRPDGTAASRFIAATNSELHYGTIGGLFTKLLWLAACALVPFFAITGVLLWRRRAAGRRPASLPAARP